MFELKKIHPFSSTHQVESYAALESGGGEGYAGTYALPFSRDGDDEIVRNRPGEAFFCSGRHGVKRGMAIKELRDFIADENIYHHGAEGGDECFWIHIFRATEEDVRALGEVLPINPSTAFDLCTAETESSHDREALFDKYHYLLLEELQENAGSASTRIAGLDVVYLHVLLFAPGIVTLQQTSKLHSQPIGCVSLLQQWLHKNSSYAIPSPDWVLHALVSVKLPYYTSLVVKAESEIQAVDELISQLKVLQDDAKDVLQRLKTADSRTSFLYYFMHSKQKVFLSLQSSPSRVASEMAPFFRAYEHSIVSLQYRLQIAKEALDSGQNAFLSMLTIKNRESSLKTTDVSSKLSFVATVMLPLGMVIAAYGMNVPLPGGEDGGTVASLPPSLSLQPHATLILTISSIVYHPHSRVHTHTHTAGADAHLVLGHCGGVSALHHRLLLVAVRKRLLGIGTACGGGAAR